MILDNTFIEDFRNVWDKLQRYMKINIPQSNSELSSAIGCALINYFNPDNGRQRADDVKPHIREDILSFANTLNTYIGAVNAILPAEGEWWEKKIPAALPLNDLEGLRTQLKNLQEFLNQDLDTNTTYNGAVKLSELPKIAAIKEKFQTFFESPEYTSLFAKKLKYRCNNEPKHKPQQCFFTYYSANDTQDGHAVSSNNANENTFTPGGL